MRRFIIPVAALMVLAGPAFAQADLKAQGDQPQTDKNAPNEPMKHTKKHHMTHKKTAKAKSSTPSTAPAAGTSQQ